jgi:hypothetical protein
MYCNNGMNCFASHHTLSITLATTSYLFTEEIFIAFDNRKKCFRKSPIIVPSTKVKYKDARQQNRGRGEEEGDEAV